MRFDLPRLLLSVLIAVILWAGVNFSAGAEEKPQTFFYYVDEKGTPCYTDRHKNIPNRYHGRVQERTWKELREKTNPKWSVPEGEEE